MKIRKIRIINPIQLTDTPTNSTWLKLCISCSAISRLLYAKSRTNDALRANKRRIACATTHTASYVRCRYWDCGEGRRFRNEASDWGKKSRKGLSGEYFVSYLQKYVCRKQKEFVLLSKKIT